MKTLSRFFLFLLFLGLFGGLAEAKYFRTVIIDPGHGGHDKGCTWGKVYEKHLALDTAARLETALRQRGFRTVMTRRSDYFISLPERVRISNRHSSSIFVSVHYNFTWKQDVSGLETYYYGAQSQPLAAFIQNAIVRRTRSVNRGAKFARFYVLRHNKLPAALVECGFVSNASTRNKMKAAWFRQAVAEGIADGVARYRKY